MKLETLNLDDYIDRMAVVLMLKEAFETGKRIHITYVEDDPVDVRVTRYKDCYPDAVDHNGLKLYCLPAFRTEPSISGFENVVDMEILDYDSEPATAPLSA